jgi:hypothetical protein
MKATFVDLRKRSGEIIGALNRNEAVTVYYRGKPKAIMRPLTKRSGKAMHSVRHHPSFGMWADRTDLADAVNHVRKIRTRYPRAV